MSNQNQEQTNPFVFVGTYSHRGSEGIYVFRLDPTTGALTKHSMAEAHNPSFIALSPDRRFLYAIHETGEFRGQPGGGVTAFAVSTDGQLSPLNQQQIPGASPCYVQADSQRRWLVTANYHDGTHTLLPIRQDGSLGPATDHIQNVGNLGPSQTSAHGHCSLFTEDGSAVYACDLGLDSVIVYALDDESGLLTEQTSLSLAPGAGPRHLVFHPTLPRAYVLNERDSTMAVLEREVGTEKLRILQTLLTLPDGYAGRSFCADLHLSPDGQFLYASNRGHDSLTVFAVDEEGLLSLRGHAPTEGRCPRNFAVLPDGLILVANQETDTIVAFRAGSDGIPVPTGAVTHVPAPVCVVPALIPPQV